MNRQSITVGIDDVDAAHITQRPLPCGRFGAQTLTEMQVRVQVANQLKMLGMSVCCRCGITQRASPDHPSNEPDCKDYPASGKKRGDCERKEDLHDPARLPVEASAPSCARLRIRFDTDEICCPGKSYIASHSLCRSGPCNLLRSRTPRFWPGEC